MKKTLLYVITALVLGVGTMLFPYLTFFMRYNESPIAYTDGIPYLKPMSQSENWLNYTQTKRDFVPAFGDSQAQTQPADASLQILTVGFIAAMAVYLLVRRRITRPAPPYRFPPV